ncbi:MAG: DUF559 domain-containing protein [Pedococcus sp.]
MPEIADQPFTRSQARRLGITPGELRGPGYRRLFSRVHVRAGVVVDTRLRAVAALVIAPTGALVARHTAAVLMGGVVPHTPDLHLALPQGRLRVPGIDGRRGAYARHARMGALLLTTAEDTFVDLAGELPLVDLVVLGDSLVKAGRTSCAELQSAADRARGSRGRVARRAVSLVRSGVDSPMESRLRLLLVLAGLPEPVVNHIEYTEDGRWRRRFDLSFPEHRLAIEYDGRQHAESPKQWERDVERREELDRDGWRLVVVLAKGIHGRPEETLNRVVDAMHQCGMAAQVTSEEWRLHFPGWA